MSHHMVFVFVSAHLLRDKNSPLKFRRELTWACDGNTIKIGFDPLIVYRTMKCGQVIMSIYHC